MLVNNVTPAVILLTIPSILIPSKKCPSFSAIPSKSIFSIASVKLLIALIPNLLSCLKAGSSLFASASLAPSIAWSIVLNSVAILEKSALLPTFLIASKNSSVFTVPS